MGVTDEDFVKRLQKVIGGKSVSSFALECGVSDSVLRQYLSGKSEPTRIPLIAIARTGKVKIEWLMTGKGPEDADHERDILSFCISQIESYISERFEQIGSLEKAKRIYFLYTYLLWAYSSALERADP